MPLRRILAALLLLTLTSPTWADGKLVSYSGASAFNGIGRLSFADGGFCTATLIRDRLVLTAAHCLFDGTAPIDVTSLEFQSGFRQGQAITSRQIIRTMAHPAFDITQAEQQPSVIAHDIAVLELERPIGTVQIAPLQVAAQPLTGDLVNVVSYGENRADTPLIERGCSVLGRQDGIVVLTCDAEFGSSGAPVMQFLNDHWRVTSVISSTALLDGQKVSLGTDLEGPLTEILLLLGDLHQADRSASGAKFVRP